MPRHQLSVHTGGRTRRERSKEHFQNGRSYREKFLGQGGSHLSRVNPVFPVAESKSAIVADLPKIRPCPVCLNESVDDLEFHLRNYHTTGDMRDSFAGVLGYRQMPGKLAYLFSNGSREIVAKVLANYLAAGFLQIPTLPPRQSYTRVLYRSVDKQPKF